MKDLFQRLRELLGLNNHAEQMDDRHNYSHQHSEIKSEVQVRTKSIYPREQQQGTARFRFPVIPDDQASGLAMDRNGREERPKVAKPVIHHARVSNPTSTPKLERKGFKPSEMISPVYGTKRPTAEQWEEKEESPEAQQIKEAEMQVEPPISTSESSKLDIKEANQPALVRPTMTSADAFSRKDIEPDVNQSMQAEPKVHQPTILPPVLTNSHPENVPDHYQHSILPSRKERGSHNRQPMTNYHFPEITMLRAEPSIPDADLHFVDNQIDKLTNALESFHVSAEVVGVVKGPTVTRYELQPAPGVKVNKFTNLMDDIKLALAAKDIRMEAPIPGRSAIGIEVPNEVSSPVFIRSIIESEEFQQHPSPLAVAFGRDIGGAPVIGDLKRMPHGLIAGSTGSGKSVCINSILVSLLFKAKPSEVRLILIDPKVVELAPYNHIPHLLTPVVTDPKQATAALKWAVEEMEKRYERFADLGVRDIDRYNTVARQEGREELPYIIIIIDELADLMMVSPHDVEEAICRIAQKARACGIHLLLATQRPSVDVITGLIKANIPTRVAFAVSSQADSRTILDMGGAERLLGKGDMLYYPSGLAKPVRLQGNFVSDDEIEQVVEHVKRQHKVKYLIEKEELSRNSNASGDYDDELFSEAVLFTIEQGQASASSLQRRFRIGYNRAARLIDMMESEGFISGQSGSKPRDVFITLEEFKQIVEG